MIVLQKFIGVLNKDTESKHILKTDVGKICAVEVQHHQTKSHKTQVNLVIYILDNGDAYKRIETSEVIERNNNVYTTNNSVYAFDIIETHVC